MKFRELNVSAKFRLAGVAPHLSLTWIKLDDQVAIDVERKCGRQSFDNCDLVEITDEAVR